MSPSESPTGLTILPKPCKSILKECDAYESRNVFLSVYFGCVFSYPWAVVIREMVEFWPKDKGGVCTWDGNYRKAAVWVGLIRILF